MSDTTGSAVPPGRVRLEALDDLLLESLAALAAAGDVEHACRLGARACALYRRTDASAWNRFNALLHRLAKKAAGAQPSKQSAAGTR